jgi:single-strand DNA-binding protein
MAKKIDVNVAVVSGNLTEDPEPVDTESGVTLCKMRIASNERIKRGEEWQNHTNYLTVTVFGNQAQNCLDYLAKGRPVAVEGKIHFHEWDSEEGKRSRIEIVARHVQFLGTPPSRNGSGGEDSALPAEFEASAAGPGGDDDLPF